jgi:hypothetical protein
MRMFQKSSVACGRWSSTWFLTLEDSGNSTPSTVKQMGKKTPLVVSHDSRSEELSKLRSPLDNKVHAADKEYDNLRPKLVFLRHGHRLRW